jgi:ABC-type antimicrobial peptide transport system permease subunit
MTANIMEQSKEIGILRSMGYTKSKIVTLYMFEAFALVLASSILGVFIGTIVGYTMVLQQVVFTAIPI